MTIICFWSIPSTFLIVLQSSFPLRAHFLFPLQVVHFVNDRIGDANVLDALIILKLPVEQRHLVEGTSTTSVSDDIVTVISTFKVDYDC